MAQPVEDKDSHLWPANLLLNPPYAVAFACVKCKGIPKACMNNDDGEILCDQCAKALDHTVPSKAVQNLINRLKTKCLSIIEGDEPSEMNDVEGNAVIATRFNDNQCDWTGMIKEWSEHSAQCPYVCVDCDECKAFKCQRKLMAGHIAECPEVTIQCPLSCGSAILRKNAETHVANECTDQLLDCSNDDCKMQIKRKDFKTHVETECDTRIIECEFVKYGCKVKQMKANQLKKHMDECKWEHLSNKFDHMTNALNQSIQENRQLCQTVQRLSQGNQQQLLPKGSIVMWSGAQNAIPDGWMLCDGNNNTPDLRNRFIIGASAQFQNQSIGGNKSHSHNITVDGHRLTIAEMPKHRHTGNYDTCTFFCAGKDNAIDFHVQTTGSGEQFYYNSQPETGGNQEHNHRASASTITHLPPYYAMCFIIKTL